LRTQVRAAWSLWNINRDAQVAVPALINGLGHEEAELRGAAAAFLGDIGLEAKAAIPALSRMAEADEDHANRAMATTAIQKIKGQR
jgi:HEAT repeat protein